MLLPINQNFATAKIFEELNRELLYFMRKSRTETTFSNDLFSDDFGQLIYHTSRATINKFESLHTKMHCDQCSQLQRDKLCNDITNHQDISTFFQNTEPSPPVIDSIFFDDLRNLTSYLYTETPKLSCVKNFHSESLHEHYHNFIQQNGKVCPCCGTRELVQFSGDIGETNDWRGHYDHLLPRSLYPQYAVHPFNLLPTCDICNSYAKGIKNPIIGENSVVGFDTSANCKCTYPFDTSDILKDKVRLEYPPEWNIERRVRLCDDSSDQSNSWKRLYNMTSRVEEKYHGKILNLLWDKIIPENATHLKQQIFIRDSNQIRQVNLEDWSFWENKLYNYMVNQDHSYFEALWAAMEQAQQEDENENSPFII